MAGWKILAIALVGRLAAVSAVIFIWNVLMLSRHQIFTISTMHLARTIFNRLGAMVTHAIG